MCQNTYPKLWVEVRYNCKQLKNICNGTSLITYRGKPSQNSPFHSGTSWPFFLSLKELHYELFAFHPYLINNITLLCNKNQTFSLIKKAIHWRKKKPSIKSNTTRMQVTIVLMLHNNTILKMGHSSNPSYCCSSTWRNKKLIN